VYELILIIVQIIHFGGGAYIAIPVPVDFENAVDGGGHHVVADVEFAAVVQEGAVDVGLDDVGHEVAVGVLDFLLDQTLYF
jgi:hypothetical protein